MTDSEYSSREVFGSEIYPHMTEEEKECFHPPTYQEMLESDGTFPVLLDIGGMIQIHLNNYNNKVLIGTDNLPSIPYDAGPKKIDVSHPEYEVSFGKSFFYKWNSP